MFFDRSDFRFLCEIRDFPILPVSKTEKYSLQTLYKCIYTTYVFGVEINTHPSFFGNKFLSTMNFTV